MSNLYSTIGGNEKQSCAVRSTAIALCLDYDRVSAAFAKAGRKQDRKVTLAVCLQAMEELEPGVTLHRAQTGATVGRFMRENTKGHFILIVRGHALALTDGQLHDWPAFMGKLNRRITHYWKAA